AGEIALACTLLVGVGLFLRSLAHALSTDPGFDAENVVALRVDLPFGTLDAASRLARLDRLLAAVRRLPEVSSAGVTDALPLGDNFGWRTWRVREATQPEDADGVSPLVRIVDGGSWEALGLRVVAGRPILDTDAGLAEAAEGQPRAQDRVVVVNEALAERLWPSAEGWNDVLAKTLTTGDREYRVVGVAAETRYFSLERDSGPEMYFSLRQVFDLSSIDLVMRTRVAPADAMPAIRQALTAAAPSLPLAEMRTMEGLLDRSTFRRRAVLGVLSGFGGFGLLLALLGVYSVIAYTVAQNRRAFGVRMAFGATGERLSREMLGQMLKPIVLGSALGLTGGFGLARALASQLYGVSPGDPLTYAAVTSILIASGLAAAYLPARRAARLEVAEVLRES
ncbi:MAG: FtsX-like permease family protein, partial [Acidobacteriota bacterium]